MFSTSSKYFIGEIAAAGPQFDFAEGEVYRLPDLPSVRAFVERGVLRPLKDAPGDWVRVREFSAEQLTHTPRPDPTPELTISEAEVAERMGLSVEQLGVVRRSFTTFPKPLQRELPGTDDNPEPRYQARYRWSAIAQWSAENKAMLTLIAPTT